MTHCSLRSFASTGASRVDGVLRRPELDDEASSSDPRPSSTARPAGRLRPARPTARRAVSARRRPGNENVELGDSPPGLRSSRNHSRDATTARSAAAASAPTSRSSAWSTAGELHRREEHDASDLGRGGDRGPGHRARARPGARHHRRDRLRRRRPASLIAARSTTPATSAASPPASSAEEIAPRSRSSAWSGVERRRVRPRRRSRGAGRRARARPGARRRRVRGPRAGSGAAAAFARRSRRAPDAV